MNIRAGKLRVAGAEVLARIQQDLAYWPEPLAGAELAGYQGSSESPTEQAIDVRLPVARRLNLSDRLLLWGDPQQGRFAALTTWALGNGVDVWHLPPTAPAIALALIDTVGITVCDCWPRPAEDAGIVCVSATAEPLQADHIGWLVAPGEQPSAGSDSRVGYIDAQGWIHVLGAGTNVLQDDELLLTPFEAIQRLETHYRVVAACLLALTEEEAQQVGLDAGFFAVAEVVGEASPVLEVELLDYVRRGLSAMKCPQGIMLVGVLPRRRDGSPDLGAVWELIQLEASSSSAADLPVSTDR